MKRRRILVFPCGSEIGLEIYRSMRFSNHFELIGGSSVEDHGGFVFPSYINDIPNIDSEDFLGHMRELVVSEEIDAIYPTMDHVIKKLSEFDIKIPVISSPIETTKICASKRMTLDKLKDVVSVPITYESIGDVKKYPVFIRPDSGYGSRGAKRIDDRLAGEVHVQQLGQKVIIQEFLPGSEYTVDCFTDRNGELLFSGVRKRARVKCGISVRTYPESGYQELGQEWARAINKRLCLRGAWFFQLKERAPKDLVLLEVACRLGGSSALYRQQGINFALLSVFDAFGVEVGIHMSKFSIVLDRALECRFKTSIDYNTVYIDYDDCVVLRGEIVLPIITFLYQCINRGRAVILLTKHAGDIYATLRRYKISEIFNEIIHINHDESKADYILPDQAIFIDDSYAERLDVYSKCGIPVFSVDAIECLLE